ncbi:MAG TPA: hypothetical protein VFQ88_03105 [Nevskiaceae bacterium]|nr:hypothetical protein [Nevskiaceae bacterium]
MTIIPGLPALYAGRTRNPVTATTRQGAELTSRHPWRSPSAACGFAFAILQTQSDRGYATSGMTTPIEASNLPS